MKRFGFTFSILLIVFFSYSQTPGIKWQRSMGGSSTERGYATFVTSDSGYLFINETISIDGDVIGNHGNSDIWVIKTNSSGIIEWKKCFGGSNNETFGQAYYHSDGSTTIFTNSTSTDGDITGNHGSTDIWIFKIDALGNLIWQISLGGTGAEVFRNADTLSDNSYILTGYTASNNGDVSGNHGGDDIWVVKLSSSGSLQWQKCLGGTGTDRPRYIKTMSDGNYVMVGSTTSTNGDVTGNHGSNDLWVVKVDVSGNIVWQKAYGGTSTETGYKCIENSGNLIILADAQSTNGDVSGLHGTAYADIWVLGISYSDGALSWQKCIGGTMPETPVDFFRNNDGSILVAASTTSYDGDASGNHGSLGYQDILLAKLGSGGNLIWSKCFGGTYNESVYAVQNDSISNQYFLLGYTMSDDGDVVGFHPISNYPLDSTADAWVMKLDTSGTIKWQKCLGGDKAEHLYGFKKMTGDEYILIGETWSNNNGDVQHNNGPIDSWIVRLGAVNTIKGTLFVDQNANGTKEPSESYYSNVVVKIQEGSEIKSVFPFNGFFSDDVDTGSYSTSVQLNLPYYSVIPSSHTSSFTNYFNIDSFSFALQPIPGIRDLVINMLPLSAARPGFDVVYKIYYTNVGTDTSSSGQVLLKKDSRLNFLSSTPVINSSNGDTLVWNYSNFKPLDTASITVNFHVPSPPTVNVGDTLNSTAWITSSSIDQTPSDDTSVVKQIARSSLDPNDKYESNEGKVTTSFITNGKYLNYLVRFQNVGTDTAFNIVIKDTLDGKLDLSTIQMITASNSYTMNISGQVLTWSFYNIKLPFGSINEAASHGFIAFRIKPNNNLIGGDTIHNTASIYFDFNLPVKTNDAFTTIQGNIGVLPLKLLNFSGVYRNEQVTLYWSTVGEYDVAKFEIQRSINAFDFIPIGDVMPHGGINLTAQYSFTDNLANVPANIYYYRLKMIDNNGKISYSQILVFHRNNTGVNSISVNPNPVVGNAFVNINYSKQAIIELRVVDVYGRIILRQRNTVSRGNNSIAITNIQNLRPGFYMVQAINGNNKLTTPFLVVK